MTDGRAAKGVSVMLWLALVWPPLAAAQEGPGEVAIGVNDDDVAGAEGLG